MPGHYPCWKETTLDDDEDLVHKRISMGQRARARIRLRVGASLVCVASLLTVLYLVGMYQRVNRFSMNPCESGLRDHLVMLMIELGFYGRCLCLSLAPLADGLFLTRFVIGLEVVPLAIALAMGLAKAPQIEHIAKEEHLIWELYSLASMQLLQAFFASPSWSPWR
jgi:hypothetical protein